jgi:oxygen-independent coproporphyrinogen-3 oxidase
MLALPPLSLYVHIPWCVRKCPYCDFNSHQYDGELPEQAYVDALISDLEQDLPWVQGRKLQSIFFGGGTPSLFSAAAVERILNAVQQRIDFAEDIEITLEANPGTSERQKFADFRAGGVNRLSIGVQSFDDHQLQKLGRIHSGDQARRAIDSAQSGGFERLNIDLMHGLPGQSMAGAASDLNTAIGSGVSHISWYQLTIEPNTEFFSRPPRLPVEDQLAEIYETGQGQLQQAGFAQYEVSAFALAGAVCQHNMNYWQFGDYIGIGAGAHGKITLPEKNSVIRMHKTRQPEHYLNAAGAALVAERALDKEDLPLEFMMNGLRLKAGVPAAFFPARTGLGEEYIRNQIDSLRDQGLLEQGDATYCTSTLGYQFLNTVLQRFS